MPRHLVVKYIRLGVNIKILEKGGRVKRMEKRWRSGGFMETFQIYGDYWERWCIIESISWS